MPLVYGLGEVAQVDFFEVWVELAGAPQVVALLDAAWMHSGRDFAMLCAQQDTTWFLAAHVAAFTHFAGVVAAVTYDNLTAAVGKVLVGGSARLLRPRFAALAAHYAFEPRFPPSRRRAATTRAGSSAAADTFDGSTWCRCRKAGRSREMSTALQRRLRRAARPGRVASRLVGPASARRCGFSRCRSTAGTSAR